MQPKDLKPTYRDTLQPNHTEAIALTSAEEVRRCCGFQYVKDHLRLDNARSAVHRGMAKKQALREIEWATLGIIRT
jgi:hypothetical protein